MADGPHESAGFRVSLSSDRSVKIAWDHPPEPIELQRWRVMLSGVLQGSDQRSAVVDIVPTLASMMVRLRAGAFSGTGEAGELLATIEAALRAPPERTGSHGPEDAAREIVLPVRYGGKDGPDLPGVAEHAGLSVTEVIERHSTAIYTVAFLGFSPGFGYLLGLPAELAAPRLPTPRTRVPGGSVGIAGSRTGVYPQLTPGGWRIIGRTEAVLFDPARSPACLLRPGDRVRFVVDDGRGRA